jgi:hypothetical protein
MDKNKFWLGGRLFNTASPRLGALTQRKARLQDGRPNATQGTSASWVPQRNARHVCNLGAPTHVRNANTRAVRTSASWAPQRNARHVCKMVAQTQVGHPNTTQGMSAMQTQGTFATQGTSARLQVGCCNATQGTSTRWSPKRKTHLQRKRPHKGALG